MIHELRMYQAVPGQMAKLQARFRDQLPPIWEKHGIRSIGFWTTLVGESSNQLTYMLQWESLADLETRWTAFLNDPAWHTVRDEGLHLRRILSGRMNDDLSLLASYATNAARIAIIAI